MLLPTLIIWAAGAPPPSVWVKLSDVGLAVGVPAVTWSVTGMINGLSSTLSVLAATAVIVTVPEYEPGVEGMNARPMVRGVLPLSGIVADVGTAKSQVEPSVVEVFTLMDNGSVALVLVRVRAQLEDVLVRQFCETTEPCTPTWALKAGAPAGVTTSRALALT